MDENTIVTAIGSVAETLGTMALVLIHPEDPLALPEPPGSDVVDTYNGHLNAIKGQVASQYHDFLEMSMRDFKAGYPDRAGAYLVEFLEKLMHEPDYQNFSADAKGKLDFSLRDLREL